MDNSIQSLADFAALVSFITFVVSFVVLIVFFVMASNIGSLTRTARTISLQQKEIINALNLINKGDRERKFDDALDQKSV